MNWEQLRKALSIISGIPEEEIDKRADYYPCYLCLRGYSAQEISRALGESEKVISDVLERHLGFPGFDENLNYDILENKEYLSEREDYSFLVSILRKFEEL